MNIKPIFSVIPKRMLPDTNVVSAQKAYAQSVDVFERGDTVKKVAVQFKKMVFDSVADWKDSVPLDNEDGALVFKNLLVPYTNFASKLSQKDTERFVSLVFGENQVEFLEQASLKNRDARLFKTTIEEHLGKTIREVVVK